CLDVAEVVLGAQEQAALAPVGPDQLQRVGQRPHRVQRVVAAEIGGAAGGGQVGRHRQRFEQRALAAAVLADQDGHARNEGELARRAQDRQVEREAAALPRQRYLLEGHGGQSTRATYSEWPARAALARMAAATYAANPSARSS